MKTFQISHTTTEIVVKLNGFETHRFKKNTASCSKDVAGDNLLIDFFLNGKHDQVIIPQAAATLPAHGALSDLYDAVQGYIDAIVEDQIHQAIEFAEYSAVMTQSSEDAPEVTLVKTDVGEVSWEYIDTGKFRTVAGIANVAGSMPSDTILASGFDVKAGEVIKWRVLLTGDSKLQLETFNNAGAIENDCLTDQLITIRVPISIP
jgi:hypothetical protein